MYLYIKIRKNIGFIKSEKPYKMAYVLTNDTKGVSIKNIKKLEIFVIKNSDLYEEQITTN